MFRQAGPATPRGSRRPWLSGGSRRQRRVAACPDDHRDGCLLSGRSPHVHPDRRPRRRLCGLLGGLIGLGGAEFRLPLLIGLFGFAALHTVILNKTMSLVVVATALPVRLLTIPLAGMAEHWDVAVNLLAGSLVGAWLGASWATRMQTRALHQVLAGLLIGIAIVLYASRRGEMTAIGLEGPTLVAAGIAAGVGIGVVASVMGVAGSELLIPTIVLLYGLDIKRAGSMPLAVSLPTMIVAFSRYSQDQSFSILASHRRFVLTRPQARSSADCWSTRSPKASSSLHSP
jgi:uncharacterized protein